MKELSCLKFIKQLWKRNLIGPVTSLSKIRITEICWRISICIVGSR